VWSMLSWNYSLTLDPVYILTRHCGSAHAGVGETGLSLLEPGSPPRPRIGEGPALARRTAFSFPAGIDRPVSIEPLVATAMPRKFAITLLLAGASACVSSGYERASATADKTAAYRDNLVRLGEEIGLTTEALRALSDNPGDSPRSNQETFETFERELTNLEDGAARSRKTFGKMDGRADTFFG